MSEIDNANDWTQKPLPIRKPKVAISIRLDSDLLAFFKARGRNYQTEINAVLRSYVEANKWGAK